MDRTSLLIASAAIATVLLGCLRPLLPTERSSWDAYWIGKYRAPPAYDVVFAGDSRVMEGVAPGVVSEVLRGRRVLNFGFDHAGWSEDYLAAIEAKLDPGSDCPTIVLSIATIGLTKNALGSRSGFHRYADLQPHQRAFRWWTGDFAFLFRPAQTKALRNLWRGRTLSASRILHADGWAETVPAKIVPRQAEATFKELFAENPVLPRAKENLEKLIGTWRNAGIRVAFFLPPSPAWLQNLEVELSGIDVREESFLRGLEVAGAARLALPGDYPTYDGAHYAADVARRFSRSLGEALSAVPCPGGD